MTATTTKLAQIGQLLGKAGAPGSFAARRTASAEDLYLEVKGLGRLRFPISRTRAQQLCRLARPARYGQEERTLLDREVRDTWEIPKSRVKIDKRRWNRTLLPVLEALRADLGLPEGCKLKADLHSMLVYAPGQFFLPHQDSEKADAMVGTLVVTLPAPFKGGAMVVEHQGEKVTYRASRSAAAEKALSFVAFYADCRHEVRPVKEGYRIVLTYNLLLAGEDAAATAAEAAPATVEALVERLREHFTTPLPPRWDWQKDAPPRQPPNRLVYLLDHQYTARGLGWSRLKGDDAARAAALRAAAEGAGCEMALALAEIHETWSCFEPDWHRPRYGRHRRWSRDEDDDWSAEHGPSPVDDPDAYELEDLVDWSITLDRWIDRSGKKAEPIVTQVAEEEVCSTTPSSALAPYASEYEGYMGNYGNTMDRWYRRAAIVLWPRERDFAVRAEAAPAWALGEIERCIRAGEVRQAREMTASLKTFWANAAPSEERRGFFAKALRVAAGLDRRTLAASLLAPFRVQALTPGQAPAWVKLAARYGDGWMRDLLSEWSSERHAWRGPGGRDPLAWIAALPRLCEALRTADEAAGTPAARLLLQDAWTWLKKEIAGARDLTPPSLRESALATLPKPLLGFLEGAAAVEADGVRDEAVSFLTSDENEPLLPCLVAMLRAAESVAPARRTAAGLDTVRRHCARRLEARLERPARAEDDWSIPLPPGCRCEFCKRLGAFLTDPGARRLEWPLAKQGRRHVHGRLDAHELPVRHETRRSGRPYTLVLTKEEALFEREARERRAWQADLAWLADRTDARPARPLTPPGGRGS